MMKSYFEEFERRYNRPKMDRVTVGFSGIDPAPKNNNEDIDQIVSDAVEKYLSVHIATTTEINAMLDEVWG